MDALSLSWILVLAFLISAITLMTGFGVGSVLTPTFTLFYDVKTAVFLVAIVHLANNFLKLALFLKHIDRKITVRFGFISIAGALAGSFLQASFRSSWVAVALAVFLIVSGSSEFLKKDPSLRIPRKFDFLGGFFSGLMGGLIGNQGAIRSAYLLNYSLTKETFVATATGIAILIDLTRIPVYISEHIGQTQTDWGTLAAVTSVAFAGTLIGKQLLAKISLERFRKIVALFLIIFGLFLFFLPLSR
ncbi:MAG: sulfite exporter TauE/SafE family protein [Ignavibacteriales bacterium]|nr:sulfite exporter TauE/SafE family protein [Ignavibacteriales bacterium]